MSFQLLGQGRPREKRGFDLGLGPRLASLEMLHEQKEEVLYGLNTDLDKLRERRKQLEYQLKVTVNEGEAIEKEFESKVRKL